MIWFNEEALLDVAPVKIVDILVSPIQMTPTARQRPIKWGADFVRMGGGVRTVSVDFALLTDDMSSRQAILKQITRWARQVDIGTLRINGHEDMFLRATCTALPEPSMRQWWESKLRVVFTAFDPYWISDFQTVKEFSGGTLSTFIDGDAPALIRLEWTNTAVSDWSFTANGQTMAFSSIPAGEIVIDLNAKKVGC